MRLGGSKSVAAKLTTAQADPTEDPETLTFLEGRHAVLLAEVTRLDKAAPGKALLAEQLRTARQQKVQERERWHQTAQAGKQKHTAELQAQLLATALPAC